MFTFITSDVKRKLTLYGVKTWILKQLAPSEIALLSQKCKNFPNHQLSNRKFVWLKVKVSGGTQTCTTELQANSGQNQSQNQGQGHHYKSYSLTGASASQLSQSVRDRLMLGSQSLPKPGSPEFTALFAAAHHRSGATSSFTPRVLKPSDGSLSDTCSTYAAPDVQGYYTGNSPYATTSWMRHSNTYTPSGRSQGSQLTYLLILVLILIYYSNL